jgi:hypothetical protein
LFSSNFAEEREILVWNAESDRAAKCHSIFNVKMSFEFWPIELKSIDINAIGRNTFLKSKTQLQNGN